MTVRRCPVIKGFWHFNNSCLSIFALKNTAICNRAYSLNCYFFIYWLMWDSGMILRVITEFVQLVINKSLIDFSISWIWLLYSVQTEWCHKSICKPYYPMKNRHVQLLFFFCKYGSSTWIERYFRAIWWSETHIRKQTDLKFDTIFWHKLCWLDCVQFLCAVKLRNFF